MRFSARALAIVATLLSMNAVPQAMEPRQGLQPMPAAATHEAAAELMAPPQDQAPAGAAWPLALGFLALVVMRRIRT